MVGHDHGPAPVPAGNDHHQVAFFGFSLLIVEPAAGPGEVEIGLPMEGQIADRRFAGHLRLFHQPPIIVQQIISQRLQVAMMMQQ